MHVLSFCSSCFLNSSSAWSLSRCSGWKVHNFFIFNWTSLGLISEAAAGAWWLVVYDLPQAFRWTAHLLHNALMGHWERIVYLQLRLSVRRVAIVALIPGHDVHVPIIIIIICISNDHDDNGYSFLRFINSVFYNSRKYIPSNHSIRYSRNW